MSDVTIGSTKGENPRESSPSPPPSPSLPFSPFPPSASPPPPICTLDKWAADKPMAVAVAAENVGLAVLLTFDLQLKKRCARRRNMLVVIHDGVLAVNHTFFFDTRFYSHEKFDSVMEETRWLIRPIYKSPFLAMIPSIFLENLPSHSFFSWNGLSGVSPSTVRSLSIVLSPTDQGKVSWLIR